MTTNADRNLSDLSDQELLKLLQNPELRNEMEKLRTALHQRSDSQTAASEERYELLSILKAWVSVARSDLQQESDGLDLNERELLLDLKKYFDQLEHQPPEISQSRSLIEGWELTKDAPDFESDAKLIIRNLYPTFTTTNKSSSGQESLMSEYFSLLTRFVDLFTYEQGNYLRPILYEFFKSQYDQSAKDIGMYCLESDPEVPDGVNMYHTDVFPDYFNSLDEQLHYLRVLWAICYISFILNHCSVSDESYIKVLWAIIKHPKYRKFL